MPACLERTEEVFIEDDEPEDRFENVWSNDRSFDDALGQALKVVKEHRELEEHERLPMILEYQRTKSKAILDKLTKHDLRYLIGWAKRFSRRRSKDYVMDLVQSAWKAYVQALNKYNPREGKFLPYLNYWIRQQMDKEIASSGNGAVNMSRDFLADIIAFQRELYKHMLLNSEEISNEELAKKTGLSLKRIAEVREVSARWGDVDSLDRWRQLQNSITENCENDIRVGAGRLISDEDLEEATEESEDRAQLRKWVKQLPREKRMYISQRFGLIDGEEKTRSFLSYLFKMSDKQIVKFEEEILEDLRQIANREQLNHSYGETPVVKESKVKRRKTFRKHSRSEEE